MRKQSRACVFGERREIRKIIFSGARKTQKEKVLTFFLSTETTTKHQTHKTEKKNREKKTGGHFIFARLMQIKKRDARDARKSSA